MGDGAAEGGESFAGQGPQHNMLGTVALELAYLGEAIHLFLYV